MKTALVRDYVGFLEGIMSNPPPPPPSKYTALTIIEELMFNSQEQ